jgi:hypothetical protein
VAETVPEADVDLFEPKPLAVAVARAKYRGSPVREYVTKCRRRPSVTEYQPSLGST